MAMNSGKSEFFNKLAGDLKKAHEAHKKDETKFSNFGELPGGITGGVAQLVEIKVDKYKEGDNKGQYYFLAAGIVKTPEVVGDVRVKGLRTQIMEPLCATKGDGKRKTFDDHYAFVLNELRKLGVDTAKMSAENFEAVLAALKKQKPHFTFSTWKPEPAKEGKYKGKESRTMQFWNGVCDAPGTNQADGSHVEDNTGEEVVDDTPADETHEDDTTTTTPADEEGGDAIDYSTWDIDALVSASNDGDKDAQKELTDRVAATGVSMEDIEAAESWQQVADLAQGDGDNVPEDEDDGTPKVGNLYRFKPFDPKTKKKSAKAVDVEVTAVDAATKTVTLRNQTNPKLTYSKVKWADLEAAE